MKFEIIIPTLKNKTEFEESDCYKSLIKSVDAEFDIILNPVFNNKTGLSELYNQSLKDSSADIIIFMHDDYLLQDSMAFKKLIKAHEIFDIVGLAGATTQDYSDIYTGDGREYPLVWHLRKQKPEDARGIVNHFIPHGFNNMSAHVNAAYFGPTPSEVLVIDGLFISVNKSKVDFELFDNEFSFHFYDMAMCVRAKQNNLKIGVWPIFGIHYGLGEFANDPTWIRLSAIFKQKYNHYKNNL